MHTICRATLLSALCILLQPVLQPADAYNNGMARVPPLGFNTWNTFACSINETEVKQIADAMVSTGLLKAGYNRLDLDDCIFTSRDLHGNLVVDSLKFPSGFPALAAYVRSRGLKLGCYTCAGTKTCQGYPALSGYEDQDAKFMVQYCDLVKVDWCYSTGMDPHDRYRTISAAFNRTGVPIVLSACEWGVDKPWLWMADYMNTWRTTGDISADWGRVVAILGEVEGIGKYAHAGGFNDMDMLEVGVFGKLTEDENIAHFSLWSLMTSPLLIGYDVRLKDPKILSILTNADVLAVNQDPLGEAGDIVWKEPVVGNLQIWSKPLHTGSKAVIFFNKGPATTNISVSWPQVGFPASASCTVYDLWQHAVVAKDKTLGYAASVGPHAVVMVTLTC